MVTQPLPFRHSKGHFDFKSKTLPNVGMHANRLDSGAQTKEWQISRWLLVNKIDWSPPNKRLEQAAAASSVWWVFARQSLSTNLPSDPAGGIMTWPAWPTGQPRPLSLVLFQWLMHDFPKESYEPINWPPAREIRLTHPVYACEQPKPSFHL